MDYNFQLPQEIGTESGTNNDGVLLGSIAQLDPTAQAYFSYAHEILWGIQSDFQTATSQYVWTPLQEDFNDATAVEPFLPDDPGNPLPQLYLAVRDGITSFKFNVSTAGVGTFTLQAQYNSPTGYIAIPGATFSANFFKATGMATLSFTPPTDWEEDPIGYTAAGSHRWLRLVITGGTVTTQPEIEGAWEVSEEISEAGEGTENPPFFNPYKDLLPQDGDTLYLSSTYQPYGMLITYTNPLDTGNVVYKYSKVDGTFGDLTVISDTSEGFTFENEVTFDQITLTASGASAAAWSTEGIAADGIAQAKVLAVPAVAADRFMIGLDVNQAGTMSFGLACTYDAGAPKYQIINGGVVIFTSTLTPTINDIIQVLRYDGKIYYMVNGENIDPLGTPPTSTGIVYFAATAEDAATEIPIALYDWSERLATVVDITTTGVVNFTEATASYSQVLPGHYYIQFAPPTDFASVSALLSKTGVAGYELGIETEGTPTNNITLLAQKVLTTNSPDNVYLVTGEQTILQHTSLILGDPDGYVNDNTFLLLVTNVAGNATRTVTFEAPETPAPVLNETVAKIGMTGIIIIHVDGDTTLEIGNPSAFVIST